MTHKYKLQNGLRLLEGDRELKITDTEAKDGIVLDWVGKGRCLVLSEDDLRKRIVSGQFKVLRQGDHNAPESEHLDLLPPKTQADFERKREYVRAYHAAAKAGARPDDREAVIDHVAQALRDSKPPKLKTLAGWYREWIKRGQDDACLVPRYVDRGRRQWAIPPEAQEIVDQLLTQRYLNRKGATLYEVIEDDIKEALAAENANRESGDKIYIAGTSTYYRYAQGLDPYTIDVARTGRKAADAKFRYVGAGYEAEAPLELVYIDFQNMKVRPALIGRGCVIRPWLVAAVDGYSRAVWAWHMSLDSPSYEMVSAGLRNGLLGVDEMLQAVPSIEHSYPVCGYPQLLIPDREKPFWNNSYDKMCLDLTIDTTYPPAATPTHKAIIERFFGTIDRNFVPSLPGNYVTERRADGRDVRIKETPLSFEDLRAKFAAWVVDTYSQRWHTGIEDRPIDKWRDGVRRHPVDLPSDPDLIKIQLGYFDSCTLSQQGLTIFNTSYNCDEVQEIRHRSKNKSKSLRVDIKIDPGNLGFVYVQDHCNGNYIKVPCTKAHMHGRDLWTHKKIRVEVNKRRNRGEVPFDTSKYIKSVSDERYASQTPHKRKRDRTLDRLARASEKLNAQVRKEVRPTGILKPDVERQTRAAPSRLEGD